MDEALVVKLRQEEVSRLRGVILLVFRTFSFPHSRFFTVYSLHTLL
jgi:hypothetical protein